MRLKALVMGAVIYTCCIVPVARAQTTMKDLGYYWKTVPSPDGGTQLRCYNVGNNMATDTNRCKMAEELVRKGYRPGD